MVKSIRPVGYLLWLLCASAAVTSLFGITYVALALLSMATALVVFIILMAERRRHFAAHKQLIESGEIRKALARESVSREKSLGLIFREMRKANEEVAGQLVEIGEIRKALAKESEGREKSLGLIFREVRKANEEVAGQLAEIKEIRKVLASESAIHEKSLGVIVRDIRQISDEISGDESALHLRNERLLSTNLKAMQAATKDVVSLLTNTMPEPHKGGVN